MPRRDNFLSPEDLSRAFGPQVHDPAYAVRLEWGDIIVTRGAQEAYDLQPHVPTVDAATLEPQHQTDQFFHWGKDRHTVHVVGPQEQQEFHRDSWFIGSWSMNKPNGEPFSVSTGATQTLDTITRTLINHRAQQSDRPIQGFDPTLWTHVRENVRRGLPGELGRKAAEMAASAYVSTEHKKIVHAQAKMQRIPRIAYSLGAGTIELAGLMLADTSSYTLPAMSAGAVALGIGGIQHLGRRAKRANRAITEGMLGKPVEASYLATQIRADFLRVFVPELYNQRAEAIFGV